MALIDRTTTAPCQLCPPGSYQDTREITAHWFSPANPHLPTRGEMAVFFGQHFSRHREIYTQYSWPIINRQQLSGLDDFIRAYVSAPQILEVNAGLGWLAYWLNRRHNLPFLAVTDNKSWSTAHNYAEAALPIQTMGAVAALHRYPQANLILTSWPPYHSTMPLRLLRQLRPGQHLLYIGEQCGCNATAGFFAAWADYEVREICAWDQFAGMHDWVYLISPLTF